MSSLVPLVRILKKKKRGEGEGGSYSSKKRTRITTLLTVTLRMWDELDSPLPLPSVLHCCTRRCGEGEGEGAGLLSISHQVSSVYKCSHVLKILHSSPNSCTRSQLCFEHMKKLVPKEGAGRVNKCYILIRVLLPSRACTPPPTPPSVSTLF